MRRLLLGAALVLLLFAAKPIHLDEPVYLRVAQQLTRAPLDPYGFEMNWTGAREPVARENMNPPGVGYLLAAAGALVGWREAALHAVFLLPALLAVAGTWRAAAQLCASPRTATLAALATPAFVVSGTTLMADVLALALWVWAVALFLEGLSRGGVARFAAAGSLAGLCFLSKYVGIALVPLLGAFALAQRRRPGAWLLALALPLAVAALYEGHAAWRYGEPALLRAAVYAGGSRDALVLPERAAIALLFLGGGFLSSLCLAPLVWRGRALALLAAAGAAVALAGVARGSIGPLALVSEGGAHGLALGHLVLFALSGVLLVILAAGELRPPRRAGGVPLALWLLGVLVFASALNWTVSVRALLPAAPAVGIVLTRALERRAAGRSADARLAPALLLLPSLAVALAVAWGDQAFARAARSAAAELARRHAAPPRTLWFQGAWGFQHYAEAAGARKVDRERSVLRPGDVLIVPRNNTDAGPLPPADVAAPLGRALFPASPFVATISPTLGAGFYSSRWGPFPFAFGANPPEPYDLFTVRTPLVLREERDP